MRFLIWSITATALLGLLPSTTLAQRKTSRELATKVKNIETDVEVLQEFLQEQGAAIQTLKTKVGEVESLKKKVGKVEDGLKATTQLTSKIAAETEELGKKIAEDQARINSIQEELARKKIEFNGQIRVRPESRVNQRTFNYELRDDNDILMGSHRARFEVTVRPAGFLEGKVSLQDARFWGSPTLFVQEADLERFSDLGPTPRRPLEDRNNDSAVRVHEAWVDMALKKDTAAVRVGRQVWDFGSGRMIGNDDWEQAGRSFDGVDVKLQYEKYLKADLLFSLLNERATGKTEKVKDLVFYGAYLTCPYVERMNLDGYLLVLWDDRDDIVRKVGTLGGRVAGHLPMHQRMFFDIEGAFQFGEVTEGSPSDNTTKILSHYAVFVHAEAGYTLPVDYSPALAMFFELASGDGNTSPNDPNNKNSAGWVPLFPTRHAVFGPMDIFVPNNIWDVGGRLSVKPIEQLLARLEVHSLHLYVDTGPVPLGGNVTGSRTEHLDSNMGTELDLYLSWKLHGNLILSGGYSMFIPGGTFESLDDIEGEKQIFVEEDTGEKFFYPRGDPAHWAFLQADLTF